MKLKVQKRLASQILKCSPKRIWLDPNSLSEIKEAITKIDIKSLINNGLIKSKAIKGVSKVRSRKARKSKKGPASRKGKRTARLSKKEAWIGKIRIQRKFLKELRDKKLLDTNDYRSLYSKSAGGFFRSKRHIKLYLEEHKLINKK